ncbi:type II secretion system protein D (GspD) [Marinobacterium halophilum]|uniref:Type II secretion system protein D (GspD) n=1 Tax=Marinobacterium halophilum TaxID=267374 RepID=A0A2P8F322_9GAMM|nr:type II secretion system secretin GspD [Marinobacterium halophilum]PSL16111.1 type II secretion system protein D (GspD) [Marinobacterium halophilum]
MNNRLGTTPEGRVWLRAGINHALLLLTVFGLSACALQDTQNPNALDSPWRQNRAAGERMETVSSRMSTNRTSTATTETRFGAEPPATAEGQPPRAEYYTGTGNFIDLSAPPTGEPISGDITFNFQDAEISEIVRTILGDILQVNYILDDRVRGIANMQTVRPINRDALIPTLEKLLQVNGAALIDQGDFFEVLPIDSINGGTVSLKTNLSADRGYQMLVVPLQYIGAQEMVKILEPMKPRLGLLEADVRRNMLTLAGTQAELINLKETIKAFDVDQLRGMSVGLFRLQSVDPELLMSELEVIFGDAAEGPLAGVVSFLPIERLNALLVITPQKKYLTDAATWIRRLDRTEGAQGLGMYVYYVQNGRAEALAEMLSGLFEGQRRRREARAESTPRPVVTAPAAEDEADTDQPRATASTGTAPANLDVGEVEIIADNENNALLIMASPTDYDKVYRAIQKLDILPLQVLVEATIVEVSLEDELRYGLNWFFKTHFGNSSSGVGTIGSNAFPSASELLGTASFEVFKSGETRALLNILASDSRLNVVSSPSLMVLDNHTAEIRVGDQVPIRTSATTNTASDDLNTTSTIQYRDTGVLLEVTPRVNAGGMVVLDITQEVNDVAEETTSSGIDSPTIIQRRINTSVAVQSGETLVLGGLIKENKTNGGEGVPYLRHVPVLGWAFGSRGKSINRTELVVMITPTAVTDTADARAVTREYQNKLRGLELPSRALDRR